MKRHSAASCNSDQHTDLSLEDSREERKTTDVPYKEAIGSLLFLATVTRPDIAYALNAASQYAESPRKVHWNAVKRILKYLKGTITYGIVYSAKAPVLTVYSDADFAGDRTT